MSDHVQATPRFSFVENFKETLEQLSHATKAHELEQIIQRLFNKAFKIPRQAVKLVVRTSDQDQVKHSAVLAASHDIFEAQTKESSTPQSNILIYDEVDFNTFYEQDEPQQQYLKFLNEIHADIFIPIFNNQRIVGSIVVEHNARPAQLYSNVERDEMLVFASYLGNIINLMQNRNLEEIIAQEKDMREELYHKHQEINQYKESMRSFLKNNNYKHIGIIYYKNNRFSAGNREAKELVPINLNLYEGHPITKKCKQIVNDVQEYKSTQKCFATDNDGSKLVILGIPQTTGNQVMLIVYHPEISDIIMKQIDLLHDPSTWDYMLYLETTETGKHINQLIPGSGEQLLNFKIALLKTALSNKATLLDAPTDDIMPVVELLHHISLRTTLHTITLEQPQTTTDLIVQLFGINPLFGVDKDHPEALLKKLNSVGTLCIRNIHLLSLETQNLLAEFIRYGFFKPYKSDQRIFSNVRIIASSNQPLESLVHEGTFSRTLHNELQKMTFKLPSVLMLPEHELANLTQGFAEQAFADKALDSLLGLTDRDYRHILNSQPNSLSDLKKHIHQLLVQKSKSNKMYNKDTFDPAYKINDPELVEIARLGKYALKDEKSMIILWNKFKNQNKIAHFLGVNRSSVNRRCKEFNLQ